MGDRVAVSAERVGFGEGSSLPSSVVDAVKKFDMTMGGRSNLPNHLETPLRDDSAAAG